MRWFAYVNPLLYFWRLDMRNFTLDNTAGCLEDSFQIIRRNKNNQHQHQDQAATLNKLCGERRKTSGIIWNSTDNYFPKNSLNQSSQTSSYGLIVTFNNVVLVIVPVTSDSLVTLKFQIKSEKAEWFMNVKQEPCQKSIAQKIGKIHSHKI